MNPTVFNEFCCSYILEKFIKFPIKQTIYDPYMALSRKQRLVLTIRSNPFFKY